ncbi:MAG: recombinase family protein [Oscillospiraceae bacterium]
MLKNRNIPFGYCMKNGTFTLNELEAEAVKQIFAQYIGGDSIKTIAAKMTVPYNSCKPRWNKNMVSRILENRRYIGENGYPAIITQEDFRTANVIKSTRYTKSSKVKVAAEPQRVVYKTVYEPTIEILQITNEINRSLENACADKNKLMEMIVQCAEMKYAALKTDGGETNV